MNEYGMNEETYIQLQGKIKNEVRRKILDFFDDEVEDYVEAISKSIWIKNVIKCEEYNRLATPGERKLIKSTVEGALTAIAFGGDIQTAADTAEWIAANLEDPVPGEQIQTYLSIYLPIKRWATQYMDMD